MSEGRSLKIRCATWDQVENFHTQKIQADKSLVIRLPFNPKRGETITLALGLPNQMVMAIDGEVVATKLAADGKRAQVKLRLHGMTDEVVARLRALVADARGGHDLAAVVDPPTVPPQRPRRRTTSPPPAEPTDAPVDEVVEQRRVPAADEVKADERDVFLALEREHRRLREAAAHEVLGVGWDAGVGDIRSGYFRLTKKFHPDVFAKHRSEAILQLAEEVFIHINKAYDRMRDAVAEAGRGLIAGPALLPHNGWVAGLEDVADDTVRASAPIVSSRYVEVADKPPAADFFDGVDEPLQVSFGGNSPEEEPATLRQDVPLTADGLFGDLDEDSARMGARPATDSSQISNLFKSKPIDSSQAGLVKAIEAEARSLMDEEAFEQARERLAAALHMDARNRPLRALYHVANGHFLVSKGLGADATTQFETALRHDPDCHEARRALEEGAGGRKKKTGLFGRFFKE